MLTISQTMDAMLKRLKTDKKAYRDIDEVRRSSHELIIRATCIELDRESLGRNLVKVLRSLHYKNKPSCISFALRHPEISIDCIDVLVIVKWRQ